MPAESMPVWSRNGHELFYRTEDQRIMVANYTVKGRHVCSGQAAGMVRKAACEYRSQLRISISLPTASASSC